MEPPSLIPVSALGHLHSRTCLKYLRIYLRRASRMHPGQIPKPLQLAEFNVEDSAPQPLSLRETPREISFPLVSAASFFQSLPTAGVFLTPRSTTAAWTGAWSSPFHLWHDQGITQLSQVDSNISSILIIFSMGSSPSRWWIHCHLVGWRLIYIPYRNKGFLKSGSAQPRMEKTQLRKKLLNFVQNPLLLLVLVFFVCLFLCFCQEPLAMCVGFFFFVYFQTRLRKQINTRILHIFLCIFPLLVNRKHPTFHLFLCVLGIP